VLEPESVGFPRAAVGVAHVDRERAFGIEHEIVAVGNVDQGSSIASSYPGR
jgi:hypothetical protein